jgi:WD40 repeat protein
MLQLASPSTGDPAGWLGTRDDDFSSVAFSPDGKLLAAGTRAGSIYLFRVAGGQLTHTLKGHTGGVWALAFSANGKSLASGGQDKTVRVWEVPTGKERLRLDGHAGGVFTVAFAPDGLRLASGGADGTALIRDLRVSAR